MTLNTTDLPEAEMRLYDQIEAANQELIRVKKIETDLLKDIDTKKLNEAKKSEFVKNSVETYNKVAQEALNSRVDMPVTHRAAHDE
jgi:hypothetical protein